MKALSLRQPWAWIVVHGGKDLENRRRVNTKFPREPILIHASQGMTRSEYNAAIAFSARAMDVKDGFGAGDEYIKLIPAFCDLERGGIVGRCRITGVRSNNAVPAGENAHPWAMAGQYGYSLVEIVPLPFVKCMGMLGFFSVPAEVVLELEAKMAKAMGGDTK